MNHPRPALAVIPARFASTRFPGKPLARETGKYLIQHVVEQARKARHLGRIVVATDDPRILQAVESFGGNAVMTGNHPNGTSRIAEVVMKEGGQNGTSDLILNIQGDEPDIDPQVIDALVQAMHADPQAPMGTVASPFAPDEDPANPNIVKVVCDQRGRALYFSRSLIPHDRDHTGRVQPLKHLGLYAYRREFLLRYITLLPTPLEQSEQLEQLRALEHGHPIVVVNRSVAYHGIDTPEQYAAFVARWKKAGLASH